MPNPFALDASHDLAGQVILITGAARRLGRAIATELAAAGAQPVLHCFSSAAEGAALAADLGGAPVLRADLRDRRQTRDLIDQVLARCGRLDALVNNAAAFPRAPFLDMDDDTWDQTLALNLTAPMLLSRGAARAGARAIVNLVDIAAWQPWIGYAAYCVSKAGLLQLTRALARELAPAVRVNAVAPGMILLPDDFDAAEAQRLLARVPLGRPGDPGDVARAVRFLLTERYVTGVCLPVDGGQGLR